MAQKGHKRYLPLIFCEHQDHHWIQRTILHHILLFGCLNCDNDRENTHNSFVLVICKITAKMHCMTRTTWLGFVGFALALVFWLCTRHWGPKRTHLNHFSSTGSKKHTSQTVFSSNLWATPWGYFLGLTNASCSVRKTTPIDTKLCTLLLCGTHYHHAKHHVQNHSSHTSTRAQTLPLFLASKHL